jgi:Heparinase II/III-like protein
MSLRACPLLCAFLVLSLGAAGARASDPLSTLRPGHPRLILLDRDLPALKALIAQDPFAAANFAELLHDANGMLTHRVHPYLIGGPEKDLLDTARAVEDFVLTLSGAYRLTGERKYADRAIAEMLAAAAYPDWNPKHTLDMAELTAALGLGYDWLYPILTPGQRNAIRGAIVRLGLNPWLEMIEPSAAARAKGVKPFRRTNNWVQVCVGGATIGALAVAEDEPARARTIVANSEGQMREIMKLFAPDGGFEEGPTYWSYATNYNTLYLAALDSALGHDFGLSQMPGFPETGAYRIQALGPTLEPANFGDAHDDLFRAPQMFWMANRFHKPEYAVAERRIDEAFAGLTAHRNAGESQRFLIFALVYYRPPATAAEPATVASFARTDQAFLRSDWSRPDGQADPNAFFVAFKGGSAKASHGHLDLGSFVLDALGERWAIDLGGESYGVPHYFDFSGPRWTYFRTRNDSHNTLTVDSGLEDLDAYARISAIGQSAAGGSKFAVLELDSVYPEKLRHWQRGVEILPGPRILVQDEISPSGEADIVWRILTHAGVQLGPDPVDAVLSLGGKKLHLRILAPAGAQFESRTLPSLAPPQLPLTGVAEVSIHLPRLSDPKTLAVLFSGEPATSPAPAPVPLAQWSQ